MNAPESATALAQALATVFGTPPFTAEYTTEHVRKVLEKLLGEALTENQVLTALRAAPYATPRPGLGKHLLKWRFSRAEGGASAPPPPKTTRRKYVPGQERPITASMKLKR